MHGKNITPKAPVAVIGINHGAQSSVNGRSFATSVSNIKSGASSAQGANVLFTRQAGQARSFGSNGISRTDQIFQELKMKPEFHSLLHLDSASTANDVKVMNQAGCAACLPNHCAGFPQELDCDEFNETVSLNHIYKV